MYLGPYTNLIHINKIIIIRLHMIAYLGDCYPSFWFNFQSKSHNCQVRLGWMVDRLRCRDLPCPADAI